MLRKLADSHGALRLLLAVPAIVMLSRFGLAGGGLGQLIGPSGEWAARLFVATLAVTPARLLIKLVPNSQHASMWLFKRRRDIGLAAFLYAVLHLGTYLVRQANIHVILYDLPYKEYLAGWISFAALVILTLTSNDWSVHAMGTKWKLLQRLTYVAAIAAYLHWLWIRLDHTAAYLHFLPLVLLEAYRLWYNFARPAGEKH